MKPILILQSSRPNPLLWVQKCLNSVKSWAESKGYEYLWIGDELFDYAPSYCRPPYNKVTQSDICRLEFMRHHLKSGRYEAVYWIDSDVLIWNPSEFSLPLPEDDAVVCAREVFKMNDWSSGLLTNNSIIGISTVRTVSILFSVSAMLLDGWTTVSTWSKAHADGRPRTTIIGTDLFSSRLMFPLRQIIVKTSGCFSERSIDHLIGPNGYRHLWFISLAHGAELCAANLCSSRERNDGRMLELIDRLCDAPRRPLGRWKYATPLYRMWLRSVNFPDRIRCWLWSQQIKLREKMAT